MKRRVHTIWAILTSMMTAFSGCRPQQPFYLQEDGDLSHYIDVATEIEYPDVRTATLGEVEQALPPLTLANLKYAKQWDLTLEDAIKTSLANAKVIPILGRHGSSARPLTTARKRAKRPTALTSAPDASRTVYDPAITETTPFNGVEYALSQFDAQWTTNLFYQKNDRQQNVQPTFPITRLLSPGLPAGHEHVQHPVDEVHGPGRSVHGPQQHRSTTSTTIPRGRSPADWNANYEVSFNQPLLAGAGTAVQSHRRSVQSVHASRRRCPTVASISTA